jgi:membrane protease YdiL (CAAX protease family)
MDVTLVEGLTENVVAGGLLGLLLFLGGCCVDAWLLMRLIMRPPAWTRLFQRLERRPWTGRDGFILALFLGLSQLLLALAGQGQPQASPDENPSLGGLLIQTLLFHATGAAVIAMLLAGRYLTWRAAFGFHPRLWLKQAGMGVLFYVAMMPIVAAASVLYGLFLQGMGYEIQPQDVITFMAQPDQPLWTQAYFLILAVAVAPFVEEMIFRGIAFPLIARRIGSVGAVLLVSFLFACMHFHLPSMAPLFLIAVAFNLAYAYTGSLIAPVVMHAMFNAVSLCAFYLFRDMLFP